MRDSSNLASVRSIQKRAKAVGAVSRVMWEALEDRQLLSIALPASPKIVTTASPSAITINGGSITLSDSAVVSNGVNPTGSLLFTLNGPNGFTYKQTVTITGNGTYTAHDTLPASALAGTYHWTVTYAGDTNNNSAADQASSLFAFDAALPTTATENLTFPGSGNPTSSYFSALITNGGSLNGTYKDWCVDRLNVITPGTSYHVDVYSSAGDSIPAGVVAIPQNFPKVNYLLNQNWVGKIGSDGHAITFGDVQQAIWILVAGGAPAHPAGITFTQSHVDQIVNNANANGKNFMPGLGQLVAVILQPVNSADVTDAQVNIAVVKITGPGKGTAEQTIVRRPVALAISTTQQPASAVVGSLIHDKATVTGGLSPTGTVTFKLYNNPNGTGTPLATSTVPLVGGIATSSNYSTTATGTDYWVATYNGDSKNSSITSGAASEPVRIRKAAPAIDTTQQPASAIVGSAIADKATVTGGFHPTGTVTFKLYDNPNGTGAPLAVSTKPLVNGIATSASYIATAIGTDYWVATYNGDSNNNSVISGIADEPVRIRTAGPSIDTTQLPASAIVGSSIKDKATVTGGNNPTGTVTFKLYNNANGTGTPLITDTEPLVAGTATSVGYTATATGTDYWVATYNGDSNNAPVTSGTADEPVRIRKAAPDIDTTQLPANAIVGSSIADKATVTGGFNPTGTVTFKLYNNPSASGSPLIIDTEPLIGGIATSVGYTATATGTDYWVATYNGDANNASVTSGLADEPVVVRQAGPAIDTTQLPAYATVGSSIADKATVTGGTNPTGTVTFRLYDNANGTGTPLVTDTEPLVNGHATSVGYTATAVGTDYWVATYNGDSNNASVTSGTDDEPVVIRQTRPDIDTTQLPATAVIGSKIADKATVTGGFNPRGTVTFKLYNNPNGTGTPLFTDTESLIGGVATSASYIATVPGTDYWVATYNGDSNNNAVTSGKADEPVCVTPGSPSISTTPGATTTTTSTGAYATIGFWHNQNGQARINGFDSGPNSKLLGNSLASNYPHLFGTSNSYTGTSLAGLTNSQVAAAYLNTWTPSGLQKNTYVQAFAVALGAYGSTGGAGSFNVGGNGAAFGVPNNTVLPIGQILTAADANFNPSTGLFYGGNSTKTSALNNVLNDINVSGEKSGGGSIITGVKLNDSATLTGGLNDTGTITFYLFAPGVTPNTTLSNSAYKDVVTISGAGTYSTAMGNNPGGFTPPSNGTYEWVAVYSGDANNNSVTSPFGSEPWKVG